jgi:hypothetical protein
MEDNEPTPSTTPPPAARTAQALRELHDRARSALAAQRERMGQLEAQLTNQLDSISETLAQQITAHGGTSGETGGQAEQSLYDVEQLRAELERTRLEWDRERELWQAERNQLVAAETGRSQSLDERQQELDARQQTLDDRAAELNQQDREQRQRQEMLDAHAAQAAEKQTELFANESALERRRAEVAELDAALQKSQLELEQTREDLRAREQKLANEQTTLANDLAALTSDQAAVAAEREALQAAQTEFVQTQNAMEAASQLSRTETTSRLALLDQQLTSERAAWERERASVEEQRKLLAKERDDLSTALDAARGELTVARANAVAAGELAEVKQDFQAALADVERLKVRVEELETELDGRPVVNETDVVELVHLRAEHEAMAQRIGELEEQAAAAASAAPIADQSDVQRRLELALDDLRDMKKRNAELEAQAESSTHGGGGMPSTDSVSSWEAMKLKMLANLEGEEDDGDEDRRAERVKIEEAIRHTEAALARKDRELADLKAKLLEAADAPPDRNAAVDQLIDADEVIAEHRARIAQLELEVTAKLREAEMELSVERAKITRETAHLAALKAEIDAHRAMGGDVPAAPGTPQHPKRRWLSKLGLSGEEDEK